MVENYYIFDERFAESFLHSAKPVRVFGFKLKPFSNWHRLQLEWVNSKILIGGAKKWDAYLAAKICTSQYPQKTNTTELGAVSSILWHIFVYFFNANKEISKLYDYIEDYNSPPKLWGGNGSSLKKLSEAYHDMFLITKDPDYQTSANKAAHDAFLQENQDSQIDDTLSQVSYYCKVASRPPKEAWNMPVGELAWMNVCFAKMEGGKVDIWTPMDEERFKENLKVRQQKIADIADELIKEHPNTPTPHATGLAAIKYWKQVIDRNR